MENDKDMEKNAGIPDGLGMCYHALGNFEEAVDFYKYGISENPRNTDFLINLSQCEFDRKNYDISINHLKSALEIGRDDP
jgi:tetratricopeptide (TPR) repeat protein